MAGRKDSEYTHQFCGPVDIEAYASKAQVAGASRSSERVSVSELAQRVTELEAELAELKKFLEFDG
jgi:uncharacterized protein